MTTIEFEDDGQDFLEWDIDDDTLEVVGCRPFQARVWVGRKLVQIPDVGDYPVFDNGRQLIHKVVKRIQEQ